VGLGFSNWSLGQQSERNSVGREQAQGEGFMASKVVFPMRRRLRTPDRFCDGI